MNENKYDISFYFAHWRIDIWLQFILIFLVLTIAIVFFLKTKRYQGLYEENSTFNVINDLYSQFYQLTNIQNDWRLSHLLSISEEEYKKAWQQINASIKQLTDAELSELNFKEKHMAVNILVFYEQVYYQFDHSRMFKKRKRFLSNLNDYFLDRLLFQNPRLAYYIISNPRGIGLHLEEESYKGVLIKFAERIEAPNKKHFGQSKGDVLFYDNIGPFQKESLIKLQEIGDIDSLNDLINE